MQDERLDRPYQGTSKKLKKFNYNKMQSQVVYSAGSSHCGI